jgi:hypothetical protein
MAMKAIKRLLKKRLIEKGRCFKTKVSMQVKMRVFDFVQGQGLTSWIEGSTRKLAEDGFVIEVDQVIVEGFHIFTDAMKEGRRLDLEWELPAEGGSLISKGKVLWFKLSPDSSSHPFEAGVQLEEMSLEQRGRWLEFTRGLPD